MDNVLHPGPDPHPGLPLLLCHFRPKGPCQLRRFVIISIAETCLYETRRRLEVVSAQPRHQEPDLHQLGPKQVRHVVLEVPVGLGAPHRVVPDQTPAVDAVGEKIDSGDSWDCDQTKQIGFLVDRIHIYIYVGKSNIHLVALALAISSSSSHLRETISTLAMMQESTTRSQ